jgi:hypothetical protein
VDEMEKEEYSPLFYVIPIWHVDGEKSSSNPDEQPTQEDTELNSNVGLYEAMI